ncbi:MAG: 5-guanidino-2-oxopentanoate decarboxylase [Paracoccaceae bacterium]|nr:5-guanidino-2-oxopentanoate decarboxylase [Paracoccaceae bacterium]
MGSTVLSLLEKMGVETIFGIPGVHTIEIYRGISKTNIRHITPRHEQGAGFMADGYARVRGKPGVCLVITGPGMTNVLTAMAQARADSIPMLVISAVNPKSNDQNELGLLHELPDQGALVRQVAISSLKVTKSAELIPALKNSFAKMLTGKPGPVHIEIPTDIQKLLSDFNPEDANMAYEISEDQLDHSIIANIADRLNEAKKPLMILGGGAKACNQYLYELIEIIGAQAITTINARGLLGDHPLCIPASPSLACVRQKIMAADVVLAIGTEFGKTDFDLYGDGGFPPIQYLIRVDVSEDQLTKNVKPNMTIKSTATKFCDQLLREIKSRDFVPKEIIQLKVHNQIIQEKCLNEIESKLRDPLDLILRLINHFPEAILVGDSTQPIYAGNLYNNVKKAGHWFNSATGYGTLGYAIPSALGAKLASPISPVIGIIGDGGFQFTSNELMTASDENIPVIFIVWNNNGYKEIKDSMKIERIFPVGVTPKPPNFKLQAESYDLSYYLVENRHDLIKIVNTALETEMPAIIEIRETTY